MDADAKQKRRGSQKSEVDLSIATISEMIESKKGELSRKLFISINQQSFTNLMVTGFEKPKPLKRSIFPEDEKASPTRLSSSSGFQENPKTRGGNSGMERFTMILNQATKMIRLFEEAYRENTAVSCQSRLNKLNTYLLKSLERTCKDNPHVSDMISSAMSEEVAVAVLTLSSKKLRVSKTTFVELVQQFWQADREVVLTKSNTYFLLVKLLSKTQLSQKSQL